MEITKRDQSGAQQFRFANGLDLIHLLSLYERKLNRDKSLEVKGASTSTNNQSVTALTGGGGTDSVRLHMSMTACFSVAWDGDLRLHLCHDNNPWMTAPRGGGDDERLYLALRVNGLAQWWPR
ncbi:uncharacterized protein [Triticum aestivum]|uniref:uncharacterized protein n=1 Tax=Triticum aestivum TaxID=4565 RepID=UPI001D032033|nr:uncharacterized protein LOC123184628 [Triticum aestivum]